jgi:hypothetical protein
MNSPSPRHICISPISPTEWEIQILIAPCQSDISYRIEPLEHPTQIFCNTRNAIANMETSNAFSFGKFREKLAEEGARLYTVFHPAGSLWNDSTKSCGRYNLVVHPSLRVYPWELLWSNDCGYLDSGASSPVVRCIGAFPHKTECTNLTSPHLLFVEADPIHYATRASDQFDKLAAKTPEKYLGIIHRIHSNKTPSVPQWDQLIDYLRENRPDILHIVAHGAGTRGVYLEGASRNEKVLIEYSGLINILTEVNSVRLLIITACESGLFFTDYSNLVWKLFNETKLGAAIVMSSDIGAEASIKFTEYFYEALWRGQDTASAMGATRNAMRAQATNGFSLQWSTPMYYESYPINPFGKLIAELQPYIEASEIPKEHIEAIKMAAQQLHKSVKSLSALNRQSSPSGIRLTFRCQEVRDAIQLLCDTIALLNRRFEPESERWADELKEVSSHTLPMVQRFVEFSNNQRISKHELAQVADATSRACENLLMLF